MGKQVEMLAVGDCVHFNSAIPHQLTSVGATPASTLVVAAEPAKRKAGAQAS